MVRCYPVDYLALTNDISALSDEQIKLIDKTKRTFEDKSDSIPRSYISFSKLKNVSLVADTFFHRPAFLSRRKETFYPCFFFQSKIDLPADKNFLRRFVNLYGSSPDRALTEREVNSCINFCYNYRNSYLIELFGDCDMIFKTIVHSISPNTCVHMTIMAESSNILGVVTIRDVIRDVYSYAADENTPLYFSFAYNYDLCDSEYNFRMIYSTKSSPEDDRRRHIIDAEHAANLSPTLVEKNLVPEFFVTLPERHYYMMPLGPDYDPDMDESDKAYNEIEKLLVADRN